MKLSAFAAFAFMLSLLSGCASKPTTPDWIAGDSAQYNSAQYLIGRGQAPTQEEAKDRARADVAKVFQVAVVVSSEDMQRSKSDSTGEEKYEQQASRSISTRTDQIIRGIQIAELWQDPATKSYYALAVLPRLQTAASLRQQISQLDEATANHIEQSRKSSDLFQKIAAASLAVETEREHESLQKSLQIVDPTGRGTESKWNSAKAPKRSGRIAEAGADSIASFSRFHSRPGGSGGRRTGQRRLHDRDRPEPGFCVAGADGIG